VRETYPDHAVWGTPSLSYFDVIGEDGKIRQLHRRMLGELFGVEVKSPPLENYAFAANDNAQVPNTATQPATHLRFQRSCGMDSGIQKRTRTHRNITLISIPIGDGRTTVRMPSYLSKVAIARPIVCYDRNCSGTVLCPSALEKGHFANRPRFFISRKIIYHKL